MEDWTSHILDKIDPIILEQTINYIEKYQPKFDNSLTLDEYISKNEVIYQFRYYYIPHTLIRDNNKDKLLEFLYLKRK